MERMEKKGKKKDVSDFAATKKKIGPRDKSDFAKGFVPKKKRVRGPKVSVPGSMRGGPPQRVAPTKKKDVSDFAVNTKTKTKTPVKTGGSYKIKSGDTMSAIAKKRGTTVAEIMKANPSIKDKNKIFAGKSLKIPGNKVVKKKKIDFSKIVSAAKKSKGRKAST